MLWSEARAGPPSRAGPGWSGQRTERAKGAGAAQPPGGLERGALAASHSCLLTAHAAEEGRLRRACLATGREAPARTQGEHCHGDAQTRRAPRDVAPHLCRCPRPGHRPRVGLGRALGQLELPVPSAALRLSQLPRNARWQGGGTVTPPWVSVGRNALKPMPTLHPRVPNLSQEENLL